MARKTDTRESEPRAPRPFDGRGLSAAEGVPPAAGPDRVPEGVHLPRRQVRGREILPRVRDVTRLRLPRRAHAPNLSGGLPIGASPVPTPNPRTRETPILSVGSASPGGQPTRCRERTTDRHL
jgi:hypothetical protein